MFTYIVRRILSMILTLIAISVVCFIIINLPPGDVVTDYEHRLMENLGFAAEAARQMGDALRERYGLNKPLYQQYFIWLSRFFRGDFGISLLYFKDVSELVWPRFLCTLMVCGITMFFTWTTGVLIGIFSATHKYSILDYFFTFLGFIGLSIPNFFLALILMVTVVFVFNQPVPTGLFSREFLYAPWSIPKFLDMLNHLWIPVIAIGTAGMAFILRVMRSSLLDVLGEVYVQTARAKGLTERVVIYKHAVRNAINPLISILGLQIPLVLSAGAITSIVLGLPTMGPLLLQSLTTQDIYTATTILMFYAVLLLLGNLLADILLAITDPRIRYD